MPEYRREAARLVIDTDRASAAVARENDALDAPLDDVVRQGSCKVISGTLSDPCTAASIYFQRGQGTSERPAPRAPPRLRRRPRVLTQTRPRRRRSRFTASRRDRVPDKYPRPQPMTVQNAASSAGSSATDPLTGKSDLPAHVSV